MVCGTCAKAADLRLSREHHCGENGGVGSQCDCQHETERYGLVTAQDNTGN